VNFLELRFIKLLQNADSSTGESRCEDGDGTFAGHHGHDATADPALGGLSDVPGATARAVVKARHSHSRECHLKLIRRFILRRSSNTRISDDRADFGLIRLSNQPIGVKTS
jgi:hypothetical protein